MILFDEYVFSKWVGSCRLRSLTPSTFGVLAKITGVASWRIWSKDASRWRDGAKPGKMGISCSFLNHSNRSSVLTFLGEKEAAQSFFLCVYSLKKRCFFFHTPSWRGPNKIPFESGITDTKFGRLVVRPDSGDPAETCCSILKPLGWRWEISRDFLQTESVWTSLCTW